MRTPNLHPGKKYHQPFLWILVLLCVITLLGGFTNTVYADDGTGETPAITTTQEPPADLQSSEPADVNPTDVPVPQEPEQTNTPEPTATTTPDEIFTPTEPTATPEISATPIAGESNETATDEDPTNTPDESLDDSTAPVNETSSGTTPKPAAEPGDDDSALPAALDPYFDRDGQTYFFRTDCTGYDNCIESPAPISAAIDNTLSLGLPDDGIINIDGGHFSESIMISSLPGSLTFQGQANGETTYLDGNLFINGTDVPISFLNFVFNGDVSLVDASQITFLDSIFNGDVSVTTSTDVVLNHNTSHAGTSITDSDDIQINTSQFDSPVSLTSVDTFSILQSSFQSGLTISQSTNGLISGSTFGDNLSVDGSELTVTTSPLDDDNLNITLSSQQGQLTVLSDPGQMAAITITAYTEGQDLHLSNGTVTFGDCVVVYNPLAVRKLALNRRLL